MKQYYMVGIFVLVIRFIKLILISLLTYNLYTYEKPLREKGTFNAEVYSMDIPTIFNISQLYIVYFIEVIIIIKKYICINL